MELVTYQRNQPKCKVPVNFNLFLVSCHHLGSVLCHNKGWDKLVDHINSSIDGLPISSNRYWDCGDPIEAIDPLDKRYDAATHQKTVLKQIRAAIKCRKDIAWSMIGMNESNHPWKYRRTIGLITEDILDGIREQYNTPVIYGNWAARITFCTRGNRLLFKMFARHGIRSISSTSPDPERRESYKKFRLKRLLQANKADDCVLMVRGHSHEQIIVPPRVNDMYIMDDGKELHKVYPKIPYDEEYIDPDLRWYVSPGSFLKNQVIGCSGYGEIGELEPHELGYALAKFRERQLSVEFIKL